MSRGARSVAQTKARFTGPPAFPDSLLFSPHGEAKCVRGPSGLGASRAEEKGASRLARAGVLEHPSYVFHGQARCNEITGGHIVCFDRRVVGNAGYSNPKPRPTVFHESRITSHGTRLFFSVVRDGWRHRKPPSGPLPPPASRCFPVRHCSPLFSKKIVLRHCPRAARSLLSCALWSGMGRLWSGMGGRRPPRRQHGLWGFHQPRDTQHGFSLFLRRLQGEQPQARPTGFSRITNHETRITAFTLFFPRFPTHDFPRHFPRFPGPPTPLGKGPRAVRSLLSCALWRGMGRLWRGMGGRRPPRRQHGL